MSPSRTVRRVSSLSMTPENEEPLTDNSIRVRQGYGVAASLLWEDRARLPALLLILALPRYLASLLPGSGLFELVLAGVVDQAVVLAFLGIVTARVLGRIAAPAPRMDLKKFLRLFACGALLSAGIMVPAFIRAATEDPLLSGVAWLLFFAGTMCLFTHYFYFMPIIAGVEGIGATLAAARSYPAKDRLLPFRALTTPFGALVLTVCLLQSFSPDGREAAVRHAIGLSGGVFKLLSVYLSVGLGTVFLGDGDTRPLELRPYHQAQLATMGVRSPAWLRHWLHMKNGLVLLLFGGVVGISNLARLQAIPPSARIEVEGAVASDRSAKVLVELFDPEYRFRGFFPAEFALASKRRTVFSPFPGRIVVDGTEWPLLKALPSKERLRLELDFETDRTKTDTELLDDLFLWYRGTNAAKIEWKR